MVTLIAVFAALALFTAVALVLLIVAGERTPTEVRLAQLRSRAVYDVDAPLTPRTQDMLALITRPLTPFRDWLRSHDEKSVEPFGPWQAIANLKTQRLF